MAHVWDLVECRECVAELTRIGSFWACTTPDCGRYALPCHHTHLGQGYTREEHERALDAQRDRQDAREAEDYLTSGRR